MCVGDFDKGRCETIHNDGRGETGDIKKSIVSYKDDRISVKCCRDSKYLHIFLNTADKDYQMQIINFGLMLDFQNESISKQNIYIEFPIVKITAPHPPNFDNQGSYYDKNKEKEKMLASRISRLLLVDANGLKRTIMLEKEKKIYANIDIDQWGVAYKLSIPLYFLKSEKNIINGNKYLISIKTPDIDFEKLRKKFGIPKEDRSNGFAPPENSEFKPKIHLDGINILMKCVL